MRKIFLSTTSRPWSVTHWEHTANQTDIQVLDRAGSIHDHKNLELDPETTRKPMQGGQDRSNMTGSSQQPSSSILDKLGVKFENYNNPGVMRQMHE